MSVHLAGRVPEEVQRVPEAAQRLPKHRVLEDPVTGQKFMCVPGKVPERTIIRVGAPAQTVARVSEAPPRLPEYRVLRDPETGQEVRCVVRNVPRGTATIVKVGAPAQSAALGRVPAPPRLPEYLALRDPETSREVRCVAGRVPGRTTIVKVGAPAQTAALVTVPTVPKYIPECKICTLPYNTTTRTPRMLSNCGHTICQECAGKVMAAQNCEAMLLCPFCKTATVVDGSIEKLLKNFAVLEIMDDLKS